MFVRRRRRWANIKPTLCQRLLFDGMLMRSVKYLYALSNELYDNFLLLRGI